MTGKKGGVTQTAKMKIVLWANENKPRFSGANLIEARDLIKKELGVDLPRTSVQDVFEALSLKPRKGHRGGRGGIPRTTDLRIRMLARVLRRFMKDAGCNDIPATLDDICEGHPLTEEPVDGKVNGTAHN